MIDVSNLLYNSLVINALQGKPVPLHNATLVRVGGSDATIVGRFVDQYGRVLPYSGSSYDVTLTISNTEKAFSKFCIDNSTPIPNSAAGFYGTITAGTVRVGRGAAADLVSIAFSTSIDTETYTIGDFSIGTVSPAGGVLKGPLLALQTSSPIDKGLDGDLTALQMANGGLFVNKERFLPHVASGASTYNIAGADCFVNEIRCIAGGAGAVQVYRGGVLDPLHYNATPATGDTLVREMRFLNGLTIVTAGAAIIHTGYILN